MNKRRIISVFLIILILACAAVSSVIAYMFKEAETPSIPFVPARAECEVSESFIANTKNEMFVKNSGNVSAYVRVRFVSYWVDSDGERVYRTSPDVTFNYNSELWLKDDENDTYYYRFPLTVGGSTPDLLLSDIVLLEQDGYYQVIDVIAEAIQSEPADAASESWQVVVSADGMISDLNK